MGPSPNLAEAVNVSLREKTRFQRLEARYRTPSGEERTLDITVSSVHAPDSEVLGAACLINTTALKSLKFAASRSCAAKCLVRWRSGCATR